MTQGKLETVTVQIIPRDGGSDLLAIIDDRRTIVKVDAAQISAYMRVSLDGDERDFAISGVSSEEQALDLNRPTTWEWDVVALRRGRHTLTFKVSAVLTGGQRDVHSSRIKVDVRVNPFFASRRFLAAYGPKVLPPASLGLLVIEFIRRRLKRT